MKFFARPLYQLLRKLLAHPKHRWWVLAGALAYLINPLDILPDAIPLVGQLDDALLVSLLISELSPLLVQQVRSLKSRRSGDEGGDEVSGTGVSTEAAKA
ncbi:MAG: DUF1232 domain-containing protein [Kaiparowitsia implicata GSE-PSE-MK54-09C]|nr:DUF1232 domain-containing protein [Kaiparowitsia implicata GSE-PSE-MK54-09C]